MNKRECPAGSQWDSLLNVCLIGPEQTTEPSPPVVVQLKSTSGTVLADSVELLSPALWIFVVLATVGSILALALWSIIYRRQTSLSRTSADAEMQQEPLQKTEPPAAIHSLPSERDSHAEMLRRAAEAPSLCSQLGAQTGPQLEEGFNDYRDPPKDAELEAGRGLPTCSVMSEHRIPLPATELGGTALVTTKTI